ncbi:MAG TPA: VOC family protein [Asticcacaulis sp.]|nr:VOC family protein [Asticcacaulis sp.]
MDLNLRRIVIFTANMERMTAFYRDVLGLSVAGTEPGWIDFNAGACNIALHKGASTVGKRSPKIVFYAQDVVAARAALLKRGWTDAGPVKSTGHFDMCDGYDPDGNRIGISGRV